MISEWVKVRVRVHLNSVGSASLSSWNVRVTVLKLTQRWGKEDNGEVKG